MAKVSIYYNGGAKTSHVLHVHNVNATGISNLKKLIADGGCYHTGESNEGLGSFIIPAHSIYYVTVAD